MNIRRLVPSDADEYHVLRLRGLKESPEAFGSTYEEEIDLPQERKVMRCTGSDEDFGLGAFDDEGRLIGMATFIRSKGLKARHKGDLVAMYVAPEARRSGVGKRLVEELIERARVQPGLEHIKLNVMAKNIAARSLYLSLGFNVFGLEVRASKHKGVYNDDEYMVLHLKPLND